MLVHERVRHNLEEGPGSHCGGGRARGTAGGGRAAGGCDEEELSRMGRALLDCGVLDLGENYPQELWKKNEALADRPEAIRWHLIGHLQTNKVKKTLPLVRWIHSVDSLKLLKLVSESGQALERPPAVCLQVNTSGEESKHGWSARQILEDSESIAACGGIPIVGLMTMAALDGNEERTRASFASLRQTRDGLRQKTGLALPDLSMGMSGDFEAAILEGATMVRIGSALFEGLSP